MTDLDGFFDVFNETILATNLFKISKMPIDSYPSKTSGVGLILILISTVLFVLILLLSLFLEQPRVLRYTSTSIYASIILYLLASSKVPLVERERNESDNLWIVRVMFGTVLFVSSIISSCVNMRYELFERVLTKGTHSR